MRRCLTKHRENGRPKGVDRRIYIRNRKVKNIKQRRRKQLKLEARQKIFESEAYGEDLMEIDKK